MTNSATALHHHTALALSLLPMPNHVLVLFQVLQPIVTAMATAEAAIPAREPYIVAEAAEGVAYHQLPTPKSAVLLSITATVADLNNKITTVSHAERCCIQACSKLGS